MAIYGISLYGRDKYGPFTTAGSNLIDPTIPNNPGPAFDNPSNLIVAYDVSPFVADPKNYSTIALSWTSPKGSWEEFRLIKNWNGFPVNENDGQILLDSTSSSTGYVDNGVKAGQWHYYAIWVKGNDGTWSRSAVACTLMLSDYGFGDTLFNNLPEYHRLLQGVMDDLPVVENTDLKNFLQVLAMGLNYIKTYYDSMQYLYDPMKARAHQLLALADELGVPYAPNTAADEYRARVANAAVLGREKGTFEEIRSMCSMLSGWDVDLFLGPNLMLSEDQASFEHPQYALWDAGVNYAAGQRVAYNGFIYVANTGGAYGSAQAPSGTAANNTWWDAVNNYLDTTLKLSDGSYAGWSPVNFSGGAVPTDAVSVGVGVQSATDNTVSWANALAIKNTGTTTADMGARSAGGDLTKPEDAVLRGVPVPRPLPWDAAVNYRVGDVVSYLDNAYVAVSESQNSAPTGSSSDPNWASISPFDSRREVIASAYVKGGDSASQALLVYPVVYLFDAHGVLLGTLDTSQINTTVYDALTRRPGSLSGRSTDVGSKAWTINSGTWTAVNGLGLFNPATGSATITGNADGQLSATLAGTMPGKTQSLTFRGTDTSNFLKATRTGLYAVQAGAATLLGTYSTAIGEGDRITAVFNGSTVTIQRNGVQVFSTSTTFNSTGTLHGILVE